jgi:hypothetical protein
LVSGAGWLLGGDYNFHQNFGVIYRIKGTGSLLRWVMRIK